MRILNSSLLSNGIGLLANQSSSHSNDILLWREEKYVTKYWWESAIIQENSRDIHKNASCRFRRFLMRPHDGKGWCCDKNELMGETSSSNIYWTAHWNAWKLFKHCLDNNESLILLLSLAIFILNFIIKRLCRFHQNLWESRLTFNNRSWLLLSGLFVRNLHTWQNRSDSS